ncbi:MAG: hypothetical protein JW787_03455 [Sedimentisphaerales bacterium]|nr:hypothetical protein [Sedimentisphaerales bacterium]
MKTHGLIPVLCIFVSMFLLNGCGGKKYADAKKVTNDYINAMDEMATKLDKAANAGDVAEAINRYTDKMEKLLPKMKEIKDKYPELNNTNNYPEELKDLQEKATATSKKYASSMMKMMSYMNDPQVQKAQEHMTQMMMKYQE